MHKIRKMCIDLFCTKLIKQFCVISSNLWNKGSGMDPCKWSLKSRGEMLPGEESGVTHVPVQQGWLSCRQMRKRFS